MDTRQITPDGIALDELLEHSSWLRALARTLVVDAADAEDLVQETWLAALRRPPRDRRNLRGWLGRVATNAARSRWRKASSADVELDAPVPIGGDPASLVAEVELGRDLAARVLELDEPYRETVLLKYWRGLDSAAIAEQLGVEPGTVRWRLKTALDRLRDRLDREHGERRDWMLAYASFVSPLETAVRSGGALSTVAAVVFGVLKVGFLAGLAAVVLAVGGLTLLSLFGLGGGMQSSTTSSSYAVFQPSPLAARGAGAVVPDQLARVDREPVATTASEASEPAARPTTIVLRAVDEDGLPIADARAEVFGTGDVFGADAGGVIELEVGRRGTVDGTGRGTRIPAGSGSAAVLVHAPGHELVTEVGQLNAGTDNQFGTVVLGPGGVVRGTVRDDIGLPVGQTVASLTGLLDQVRVGVLPPSVQALGADASLDDPYHFVVPDENGTFEIHGVPSEARRIAVVAEGWVGGLSEVVNVDPDQNVEGLDLTLARDPGRTMISGRVLPPEGEQFHERYPGVDVGVGILGSGFATTFTGSSYIDAQGRFVFDTSFAPYLPLDWSINVSPSNGRPWAAQRIEGLDRRAKGLVIQLRRAEAGWLRVVSSDGQDLPNATVRVPSMPSARSLDLAWTGYDEPATHEFLAPDFEYFLTVVADGHEQVEVGPFGPGAPKARVELVLDAIPGIEGRVIRPNGEPVERFRVQALAAASGYSKVDGFRAYVSDWVADGEHEPWIESADGSFRIDEREAGRIYVRVSAEGLAPADVGPFRYRPDVGLELGEIALTTGGVIAGNVRDERGLPMAGAIVGISRGDGDVQSVRTSAEGDYRFERLTPGDWQVRLCDSEASDYAHTATSFPIGSTSFRTDCTVQVGQTTWFDLSMGRDGGVAVQGRVLDRGEPASGWTAQVSRGGVSPEGISAEWRALAAMSTSADELDWCASESDGSFRLTAVEPGPATLTLVAPNGLAATREIELGDQPEIVEADFDSSPLTFTGLSRLPGRGLELVAAWDDGTWFGAFPVASGSDESTFELPHGRIRVLDVSDLEEAVAQGRLIEPTIVLEFEHGPGHPDRVDVVR